MFTASERFGSYLSSAIHFKLTNNSKDLNNHFAHDTAISAEHKHPKAATQLFQGTLNKIQKWLKDQ